MPPLIRRPRGLTGGQLGLALFTGVLSGVYIFKPGFDNFWREKAERIKREAEEGSVEG